MGKRQLGLGKINKNKKKKVEEAVEAVPDTDQLTVELSSAAEDDEFVQVKSLFEKFKVEQNELILNGVIHECDRLIRNENNDSIPSFFYKVYSDSLLELIQFSEEDETGDLIDLSLEKIELGLERFAKDALLNFQISKVLLHQVISKLGKLKSGKDVDFDFFKSLKLALDHYEIAESNDTDKKLFDEDTFQILGLVDDTLESVDDFGSSDEEDGDEAQNIEIPHILQPIAETEQFNLWWRDHSIIFYKSLKDQKSSLFKKVSFNLGQSYLKEAEEPSSIFTTLMYDESCEDKEINGLDVKTSQKIGIQLFDTAIKYLRDSWDEENVESWVNLSESLISLGNLYDLDSDSQIQSYKEAEAILRKANNVTNGKYKDILENLLEE